MTKCGYIAIIGQTNVGKSTLLNALLGEHLSIVSPKVQTTRQRILGILTKDNCQMIFLDTPGYHESSKKLNQSMLRSIDEVLLQNDMVCLVLDPKLPRLEQDKSLLQKVDREKCIVLVNKADLVSKEEYESLANKIYAELGVKNIMFLSALKEEGTEELIQYFMQHLPEGPFLYPEEYYTNHTERFLCGEIIREKAFLHLHEEIPYSCAVEIEKFEEPSGSHSVYRIFAAIIVERDSQKGMVIGKGGKKLKEIGFAARKDLELMFGTSVYLELFVKVKQSWTKNDSQLKDFGY